MKTTDVHIMMHNKKHYYGYNLAESVAWHSCDYCDTGVTWNEWT